MTKAEFEVLSDAEQEEIVMDYGQFVINYVQDNNLSDVYKFSDFFVKFCYDLSDNADPRIITFTSTTDFHLYDASMAHIEGSLCRIEASL